MVRKGKRTDHPREPRWPRLLRRQGARPSAAAEAAEDPNDQPFIRAVQQALYGAHPIELLDLVSQIVTSTEARSDLEGDHAPPAGVDLDALSASFEAADLPATTGVLHVIAAMTGDGPLAARIRGTLDQRAHRLPTWVTSLAEVSVDRVVEMRHVVRDGEKYFLDVRLPGDFWLTVVVDVDNSLGRVVTDAQALDRPLNLVLDQVRPEMELGASLVPIDRAEARSLLEEALRRESTTYAPRETESWPGVRPLVRWLVGRLPSERGAPEQEAARDQAPEDEPQRRDGPLPDEPFDWTGVEEDIRPKVAEILELCDQNAETFLDTEHRTANRRLLHDLAVAEPAFFRGRATARTSAAAVSYLVAHANAALDSRGPLTVTRLLAPFGVKSAGQRAQQFRGFLGLPPEPEPGGPMVLWQRYLVLARRGASG